MTNLFKLPMKKCFISAVFFLHLLIGYIGGGMSAIGKVTLLIFGLACITDAVAQQQSSESKSDSDDIAINLVVETQCSATNAGTWIVSFRWTLADRVQRVMLDVTQFFNGWDTERFETIFETVEPNSNFDWSGGDPGGEYLWRVRSYIDDRWRVSETARLQIPVCPVDFVEREIRNGPANPRQ